MIIQIYELIGYPFMFKHKIFRKPDVIPRKERIYTFFKNISITGSPML